MRAVPGSPAEERGCEEPVPAWLFCSVLSPSLWVLSQCEGRAESSAGTPSAFLAPAVPVLCAQPRGDVSVHTWWRRGATCELYPQTTVVLR